MAEEGSHPSEDAHPSTSSPPTAPELPTTLPTTLIGRLRAKSQSLADTAWNFNPQPGMWAATGTAIAHAPTLTELRSPIAGGENIEFNGHGHSARTVTTDETGAPMLSTILSLMGSVLEMKGPAEGTSSASGDREKRPTLERQQTLSQQAHSDQKHTWKQTLLHALTALSKFLHTPTGLLIALYALNIIAWGAMLFFLLLDCAPAMDHQDPSADSNENDSARKKWIEIDSQILNALFCITGFGLAPWRGRDLWWLYRARFGDRGALERLGEGNGSWFRGEGDIESGGSGSGGIGKRVTFTGEFAPPTEMWKLTFVVWMYALNTVFQCVLAGFMWGYDRIDRPSWATGTFIALGCGVSLLAGVMMWWEGRKVKRIEGPMVVVVERKSHRPLR